MACSRCGPRSWVFCDRNIKCCSCGLAYPKPWGKWPQPRESKGDSRAGHSGGKGKGGRGAAKAATAAGEPQAGGQSPGQADGGGDAAHGLGLDQAAIDRLHVLLQNSSAELRDLLLPAIKKPPPPELPPASVGAAGQRLAQARGSQQKAQKKLERARAEAERLEEALVKAKEQLEEATAEAAEEKLLHDKALAAYSEAAGPSPPQPASEQGSLPPDIEALDQQGLEKELEAMAARRKLLEQALRKASLDDGEEEARRVRARKARTEAAELQRQAERAAKEAAGLQAKAEQAAAAAAGELAKEQPDASMDGSPASGS